MTLQQRSTSHPHLHLHLDAIIHHGGFHYVRHFMSVPTRSCAPARDHAYTLSSKDDDEDQGAPRMGGTIPGIPAGTISTSGQPSNSFCVVLLNKQHPPEHENELEYSVYTLGRRGTMVRCGCCASCLACWRPASHTVVHARGPAFIRCLERTTVEGTSALLPVSYF